MIDGELSCHALCTNAVSVLTFKISASSFFEFAVVFRRFFQFRRADECEIRRVEKQHEPLALVAGQFHIFDFFVRKNLEFEVVDPLAYLNHDHYSFSLLTCSEAVTFVAVSRRRDFRGRLAAYDSWLSGPEGRDGWLGLSVVNFYRPP